MNLKPQPSNFVQSTRVLAGLLYAYQITMQQSQTVNCDWLNRLNLQKAGIPESLRKFNGLRLLKPSLIRYSTYFCSLFYTALKGSWQSQVFLAVFFSSFFAHTKGLFHFRKEPEGLYSIKDRTDNRVKSFLNYHFYIF